MDLTPGIADGAIICNLSNVCTKHSNSCESCCQLVIYFHNWLLQTQLQYTIIDFQDEREVCTGFLEEILYLKNKLPIPFFFTGLMPGPLSYLKKYNTSKELPVFTVPEDAVRALRMLAPTATEKPVATYIYFGEPLSRTWNTDYHGINPVFLP